VGQPWAGPGSGSLFVPSSNIFFEQDKRLSPMLLFRGVSVWCWRGPRAVGGPGGNPRTHSGRRPCPSRGRCNRWLSTDGHGPRPAGSPRTWPICWLSRCSPGRSSNASSASSPTTASPRSPRYGPLSATVPNSCSPSATAGSSAARPAVAGTLPGTSPIASDSRTRPHLPLRADSSRETQRGAYPSRFPHSAQPRRAWRHVGRAGLLNHRPGHDSAAGGDQWLTGLAGWPVAPRTMKPAQV
jgi:hypothetical protein